MTNEEKLIALKTEDEGLEVEYEILPPCSLFETNSIKRQEIALALKDIEKQKQLCQNKIAEYDADIERLTNNADNLDYAISVVSGIITGLIDSFGVRETNIDIESVEKELEKKFHTAHDNAFTHKTKGGDQVSSPTYHRLDDLAHHPTLLGLTASILARFCRIAIFSNEDGNRVFFIDKTTNKEAFKKEVGDLCLAWSLAALSGLLIWLANMARNKYKEEMGEDIPKPLKKIIYLIAATPAIIDFFLSVDKWIGHIASDVSTSAGIPGFFLSVFKEISMLPMVNKMHGSNKKSLAEIINNKYHSKEHNVSQYGGIVFSAVRKQSMPVIINEILVRGFYFVRRLVMEYKKYNNFYDMDWENVFPFGNRTVERMMTIATGTFTAVDMADATIRGAAKSGGTATGFFKEFVLRVNFVGVGRFAIAVGTDVGMGVKRNRLRNERMEIYSSLLYYSNAQIFYLDEEMWCAAQEAEEALNKTFEIAEQSITTFVEESDKILQETTETAKLLSQKSDSDFQKKALRRLKY